MNTRVTAATPRAIGWDLAPSALSGMYSGLPVVDSKRKVIGVVAEFDLLQAIHEGRDFARQPRQRRSIRLPIVGEDGKLVGVIARADILSRMIEPEFVTIFGD